MSDSHPDEARCADSKNRGPNPGWSWFHDDITHVMIDQLVNNLKNGANRGLDPRDEPPVRYFIGTVAEAAYLAGVRSHAKGERT